jgi:DNA-binding transcriptional ArsR family regulator
MSSERQPGHRGEGTTEEHSEHRGEGATYPNSRTITDPRAMRALAHPVRIALLEALAHAGTLTATQASQILGESPANCAFHLRTLAKYGYVEETGGGRGRERPWRRAHESLRITSEHDDPQAALAAGELEKFFMDTVFDRARAALSRHASWPAEWQHNSLGGEQAMTYLTPEEARQLRDDTSRLLEPYFDRADYPDKRPPGAMPVEIVRLSYPLLHLLRESAAAGDDEEETGPGLQPG